MYLLDELLEKSLDKKIFPLLPDPYDVLEEDLLLSENVYPRYVNISGKSTPLFSGGIVSSQEIEAIAKGSAQVIYRRHRGKSILIIVILEGARPFADSVERHLRQMMKADLRVTFSTLQVSSYKSGSTAVLHEVVTPLAGRDGARIHDLHGYDCVLILDDLIDSGETINWLVNGYLPSFGSVEKEAYFMLEKKVQRSARARREIDLITQVIGKIVPDEWVVGFGLDLAFPGGFHLFRGALPGGIYAFNEKVEKELGLTCKKNPQEIQNQLGVYLSGR